ncbi:unnamed protein product [Rhizoctonia solani]|uniref:Jacalin-type lectin domain-containing protein n=1 Tax=Rhizoctonia solani TaxID=456999 RepID=A0A8H3AZ78_9AGAM|nr:unnamed protein product [Rhizoctonia solani]
MSNMPGYSLLEQSDFLRGVNFGEPNGPYKSSRQAARLRENTVFSIQPCQHNSTEEFYPRNEIDARYIHMGWPASTGLPARPWGTIYQEPKANSGNWVSRRMIVHRWTVSVRHQDIEPSSEFLKAVEAALKASGTTNQMEELRGVLAAWLLSVEPRWPQPVCLDQSKLSQAIQQHSSHLIVAQTSCKRSTVTWTSPATLRGDWSPEFRHAQFFYLLEHPLIIEQGGNPEIFSKSGFNAWLTDVVKNDNSSTWRIVKVNQGIPITEILPKALRQKINRLFSYGNMITRSAPCGAVLTLGFDGAAAGVKDIGQIKVWYDANGMKDLAIVYTDGTETGPYGFGRVPANKVSDTFVLAPGEFITNIFVWNNATTIKALQLVKNTYEVSQRYGDSTDADWPTLCKQGGNALVGMSGNFDANWLTQLQPVWRSDIKANNHRNFELTYINNGTGTTFNDFRFLGDPSTSRISRIHSKPGGNEVHQETPVRGTDIGNRDSWTLAEGEYITKVKGRNVFNVIYQIEFVTNKGNTKQFGQAAGTEFVQDPPSKDMVLCFFIGSCGGYIQSLILAWGPPPE